MSEYGYEGLMPRPDAAELTRLRAELAEAQRERDGFREECQRRRFDLLDAERDRDAAKAEAERMREAAAREAETATYAQVSLCCNGHECGCQGASVGQYVASLIRAIPLPSDDEMVAMVAMAIRDAESRIHALPRRTGPASKVYTTIARAAIAAMRGADNGPEPAKGE